MPCRLRDFRAITGWWCLGPAHGRIRNQPDDATRRMVLEWPLNTVLAAVGFKVTLTLGAARWVLLYLAYARGRPRSMMVGAQALHGLAYVLFMIVGQVFANQVAPEAIRSSMQALIFAATVGVGLFVGSHLAGIVMDRFCIEGKFHWRKIWLVPLGIMLVGTLVLATAFQGKLPGAEKAPATAGAPATHSSR